MLEGLIGIRLILMIGDIVPLPAPLDVSQALSSVQVTCDAENGDGFQMTFALARDNPVDYHLMQRGLLRPPSRVIIAVLVGVTPHVLIDGVITHHQIDPGVGTGAATITVMGRPLSAMMDLVERNEQYPNQPDFMIVTRLIGEYARYGLIPAVTPTANVPIMTGRIPRQAGTDLEYIEKLARDNGFVFYIDPVSIMVNRAYWGPENRLGVPQPALTVNMGPRDNVTQLSFSLDALAASSAQTTIVEPITKMRIPIPSLPSLKIPPLALRPAQPLRQRLRRESARRNPAEGMTDVLAAVTGAPDAVTAEGELDTMRYGGVLRARALVGVRGVGLSYNGLYYVRRVSHMIERGSYRQSFSLSREGTISSLPVVRP